MSGEHVRTRSGPRRWLIAIVCVVVVAIAAGGFVAVDRLHSNQASATPSAPPPALTVDSVSPTGANVAAGSTVTVQFSTDLAPGSPMPTLSPPVAGSWAVLSPSLLEYQATGPLVPGATETVTVPGGSSGVVGSEGQRLAQSVTSQFTVAPGSILRLQQLLAELGYLPLTFTPASPLTSPTQEGNDQVGSFTWRWPNQPLALETLWTPGTNNVITQGAVMNFESQNGLKTDGLAGPQVWTDLLADVQSGKGDALSWDYVLVSQSRPSRRPSTRTARRLQHPGQHRGGRSHHRQRDLAGLRPLHGDHNERDQPRWLALLGPGHPVGELLQRRGRPARLRAGVLWLPQSDGCVEMPVANAAVVFPLTPIGTLVTVQA